jgi:hypothetical protein
MELIVIGGLFTPSNLYLKYNSSSPSLYVPPFFLAIQKRGFSDLKKVSPTRHKPLKDRLQNIIWLSQHPYFDPTNRFG